MKQFNLTVPKSCHENWDQMTPEDKGRFCGSCQKVVVDFTNMSDRELATFFKKPKESVCGRFHPDQLNKTLVVPKKRIPWIKYFFTITWPAFVLLLKSCGQKDRVVGKVQPATTMVQHSKVPILEIEPMVGEIAMDIPVIIPAEPAIVETMGVVVEKYEEPQMMTGEVVAETVDTIAVASEDSMNQYVAMDTVSVTGYTSSRRTMGLVSRCVITSEAKQQAVPEPSRPVTKETGLLFYPNPIQAGGTLHVKFADPDEILASIQVLTSTGQRILFQQSSAASAANGVEITLPTNLSAGVYFVQVLYKDGTIKKSSILVSR